MTPIGVGIIGGTTDRGWAAAAHYPALRALPDFRVVAVSTSRLASARKAADDLGIDLAYDDHRALVARPEVDLVVVSVKVPFHRELVLAAFDAGKHVLCEWPLGRDLDEALEMAEAARGRNLIAAIGLQARSSPVVHLVKRLIADGFVGEVLSSSVVGSGMHWADRSEPSQAYMLDQANGASMLSIACGHMLDAMCDVLGEFTELVATTAIREPIVRLGKSAETATKTVADQVAVSGTLASGAVAAFHYRARPSRGKNFYWEINGTDGDLVMEAASGQFQLADVRLRGARAREALAEICPTPQDRWVPADVPDGPALNVAQVYALLAQDLRTGSRQVPDFDDAVVRHRMLAAIGDAAQSGKRQSYAQPCAAVSPGGYDDRG